MEVLSKDKIERWIVPHLSKGSRGTKETSINKSYNIWSNGVVPFTMKIIFYQVDFT